jgi:hypothetical protein
MAFSPLVSETSNSTHRGNKLANPQTRANYFLREPGSVISPVLLFFGFL